jgi:hypothetical protein
MTRYIPFPEGVYNLSIVKYEEKESTQKDGDKYYIWTLRILDPLPEEFTKDTFSVLTPTHLTEKNALRKFFTKVGFGAIEVGQAINLDDLVGHRFVAKVAIKTLKNQNQANELGEITLPEYDAFMAAQPQTLAPRQAPRPMVSQQAAAQPTTIPRAPQARPAVAPMARPATAAAPAPRPAAAPVAPRAPRPAAAPPPPPQASPAEEVVEEAQDPVDGDPLFQSDGTAEFPSQA